MGARKRWWMGSGGFCAGVLLFGCGVMAGGCGVPAQATSQPNGQKPSPTITPNPVGSHAGALSVSPLASGPAFSAPLDAVSTADGKTIYFSAFAPDGQSAIFRVARDGGEVSRITAGDQLVLPASLAISSDDRTLYVSDSATATENGTGTVFALDTKTGTLEALSSDANFVPSATAVGADKRLYSVGVYAGAAALVTLSSGGGAASLVALHGVTLSNPFGISVARDGTVYLVDTTGNGDTSARVVRVLPTGQATTLATGLHVSVPAGIALNKSEDALLVASSAGVMRIAVDGSGALTAGELAADAAINALVEPAGLHRAAQSDQFVLVDQSAALAKGGDGTIFIVQ